jgi:hypothetical protein
MILQDFLCLWLVFTWKSGGIQLLNGNANETALGSRVLAQS